jgi:hypothetical protein
MSIRRLEAEAVRDAMLAATGLLNQKMLGAPMPVTVDEVGQTIIGLDNRDSAGRPQGKRGSLGGEQFRRSVYVQVRRSRPLSMLETFDAPLLNPNCEQRNRSTVAPQSLLLMNSEFVLSQSQELAERVLADACCLEDQIRLAWQLALGHEPNANQLAAAMDMIAVQEQEFAGQDLPDKSSTADPAKRALATFCQALFSSNHFLYID